MRIRKICKKSDLAKKIGKSDSYISKAFSCLKLDTEIIDHIQNNQNKLSITILDEIARVKDPVIQKEVYEKYNAGEITRDDIKDFRDAKIKENFPREKEKKKKLSVLYLNKEETTLDEILDLSKANISDKIYEKIADFTIENEKKYKITIEEM